MARKTHGSCCRCRVSAIGRKDQVMAGGQEAWNVWGRVPVVGGG